MKLHQNRARKGISILGTFSLVCAASWCRTAGCLQRLCRHMICHSFGFFTPFFRCGSFPMQLQLWDNAGVIPAGRRNEINVNGYTKPS